jgi:hypothetical protein
VSEEKAPVVYNQRLHDLLAVFARQPDDAQIKVTSGTIALLMGTGRHSSEHLRALWGAANLPKTLTGKQARELLERIEAAQKKMLEQNSRKHYVQVGPDWKEIKRRITGPLSSAWRTISRTLKTL